MTRAAPRLDRLSSFPTPVGLTSNSACAASSLPRRPKKRGPFQLAPVILRAIADRLA